ncbi:MAG: signal peptidase II [Oscillospiraceae bacterium]|nr:signal peptidase II [Oscillospiraceae bacterium]
MINILIVAVLVALDQLFKHLATQFLSSAAPVTIIPNILGLNYVHNYGAGFSILSGKVIFLIIVTSLALVAIALAILMHKFENRFDEFCFVLILAGGIGNLIDRSLNGFVVDYLEFLFIDFPVFNFADILICCGVGLFMVYTIATEFFLKKKKETDSDEQ